MIINRVANLSGTATSSSRSRSIATAIELEIVCRFKLKYCCVCETVEKKDIVNKARGGRRLSAGKGEREARANQETGEGFSVRLLSWLAGCAMADALRVRVCASCM